VGFLFRLFLLERFGFLFWGFFLILDGGREGDAMQSCCVTFSFLLYLRLSLVLISLLPLPTLLDLFIFAYTLWGGGRGMQSVYWVLLAYSSASVLALLFPPVHHICPRSPFFLFFRSFRSLSSNQR
jgi:hypothetical protein